MTQIWTRPLATIIFIILAFVMTGCQTVSSLGSDEKNSLVKKISTSFKKPNVKFSGLVDEFFLKAFGPTEDLSLNGVAIDQNAKNALDQDVQFKLFTAKNTEENI